jgi:hypothetical protein
LRHTFIAAELKHALNRLAVVFDDHVVGLDAGLGRRAVFFDRLDEDAGGFGKFVLFGAFGGDFGDGDAEPARIRRRNVEDAEHFPLLAGVVLSGGLADPFGFRR